MSHPKLIWSDITKQGLGDSRAAETDKMFVLSQLLGCPSQRAGNRERICK